MEGVPTVRLLAGVVAGALVAAAVSGCGAQQPQSTATSASTPTATAASAPTASAPAATAGSAPSVSRLVGIRAAHHAGYDRVTFDFSGAPPSHTHVRYVKRLVADGSGLPVQIAGRAILEASFFQATTRGASPPTRTAFALPNLMSAVRSGDFEAVVSYGMGLTRRASVHVSTLTKPGRVVIDIGTPFRTVLKRVYLENVRRFVANTPPYVTAVMRPVPPHTPAIGVMDRLFAGPTQTEFASGLRLQRSGATGYSGLSIGGSIARVRLTGACSSHGSTFTVADEIGPTLKQFAAVRYVKIYDAAGHTENPNGPSDSIPVCLEP